MAIHHGKSSCVGQWLYNKGSRQKAGGQDHTSFFDNNSIARNIGGVTQEAHYVSDGLRISH